MTLADQLTLVRILAVPVVIVLFVASFDDHYWWATGVFIAAMTTDWFDGRVARRYGHSSPLGSLLDPVADKVLVLTVLIVLIDDGVFPGWMVALIVAREFLVSGLRLAALERGVVMQARDLGQAEDVVAGDRGRDRRVRRRRRVGRGRRLVGAARRARADVALRARLRARRAGAAARQARVVLSSSSPAFSSTPRRRQPLR